MPNFVDYTGKKMGRLTFLRHYKKTYGSRTRKTWVCLCDCGREIEYKCEYISVLKRTGAAFECTTCKEERRWPDLTDKVFGRLTVLKHVTGKKHGQRYVLCRCECGIEKVWLASDLTSPSKAVKSCGCYARKLHSKWVNTSRYPPAHGAKSKNAVLEKTRIYSIRNHMVSKCYNKDNKDYHNFGGKGITVCELWRNGANDFYLWSLKSGYKEGHGIFIKKGEKEFNPSTTFWRNKKDIIGELNSKYIEWKGKTQNIGEWAKEFGCSQPCLSYRLKVYSFEDAMNYPYTPKRAYRNEHLDRIDEVEKLYLERKSMEQISKETGISSAIVKKFLDIKKVKRFPRKRRTSLEVDEKKVYIMDEIGKGRSPAEIGDELGFGRHRLYHYVRQWKDKDDFH